ncbi:MAG: hypothetical protein KBE09_00330 [Candidatus Pacebacteria bacterium]|nr:hypothetical protein [Candidatus Paceibacterota bacterium]
MKDLTVKALFTWAWEKFTQRPWMFIGLFALALVVSAISSGILSAAEGIAGVHQLLWLGDYAVQTLVSMGIMAVGLKAYKDTAHLSVHDLWHPTRFVPYLIVTLLTGIAVIVGLVLLVVPGLVAMTMFLFAPYLVLDKGMSPIDAMKHSMKITEGRRMSLFVFLLSLIGANILGALLLGVGLLVSVPVSLLATVRAYRLIEAMPKAE